MHFHYSCGRMRAHQGGMREGNLVLVWLTTVERAKQPWVGGMPPSRRGGMSTIVCTFAFFRPSSRTTPSFFEFRFFNGANDTDFGLAATPSILLPFGFPMASAELTAVPDLAKRGMRCGWMLLSNSDLSNYGMLDCKHLQQL